MAAIIGFLNVEIIFRNFIAAGSSLMLRFKKSFTSLKAIQILFQSYIYSSSEKTTQDIDDIIKKRKHRF